MSPSAQNWRRWHLYPVFFFSSRRRHTRYIGDWSSDVCSSDLQSDGSLKQRNGQHQAIASLESKQDPFQPAEWSDFHSNSLSHFEEHPGLPGQSCLDRSLERDNFLLVHGNRCLADSHDLDNPGRREDGKSIEQIESAKQVAWEKRDFKFLHSIGPAPLAM